MYQCEICQSREVEGNSGHFGKTKSTLCQSLMEKTQCYTECKLKGRTRNLHCNMLQPCDDLLGNFNWNFTNKGQREAGSSVKNKTQKVEKHKEIQEESSEDELPQFTPTRMRPLIDDIRLLDRRTTTSNDQKVFSVSL